MKIIPAIDIIDGKCVRLTKGDYNKKKVYNHNPVEIAKLFESKGLKRLHVVDLDGAKRKKVVNLKVIEKIAHQTKLIIDMGGGIQTNQDIEDVFDAGINMITAGSIAIKNPELTETWIKKYGAEKIILGADINKGQVAIHGWQTTSTLSIYDFLKYWVAKGIKKVISTDIAKDGMLEGPSIELYNKIRKKFNDLSIIASGGVANMNDVRNLADNDLYGVIIGKAIYEDKIRLEELVLFERGYKK